MPLIDDVKFNCDVSDARYWGFFSICGLLLRYRDLYRSEKGLTAWANINREDIAAWIETKEAAWPRLEHEEFRNLTVDGKEFHPFDVEEINRVLGRQGLVYGAGYGMYMKPTFFLADLKSNRQVEGLDVHTSGREHVRDLLTAPAMLQGETVFLRLEPLLILLHFKMSEIGAQRNGALQDAFSGYGFGHRQIMDEVLERRLEEFAERYAVLILRHEIAEYNEEIPGWKEVLAAAGDRKNEHYLRAVKDLIADTSESGPLHMIIRTRDRAGLGMSVGLMEGFHRVLFPEIRQAYAEFTQQGDWGAIETTRERGYERFIAEREKVMEMYRNSSGKDDFSVRLRKTIAV